MSWLRMKAAYTVEHRKSWFAKTLPSNLFIVKVENMIHFCLQSVIAETNGVFTRGKEAEAREVTS